MHTDQTIAALSTAYGKGGVALIRISGKDAFTVAKKLFVPKKIPFENITPRRAVFGDFYFHGKAVDNGILTLFPASSSYTGEDTAECSCHGGILLSELLLQAALENGAVLADKGEFTFRAMMNGNLSLSQVEAIPDLIEAESVDKLTLAAKNSGGALERELASLRERILKVVSSTYAYIDYPDEDLTELTESDMKAELGSIRDRIDRLLSTYRTGKAVSEGIRCAIVGRPNTGKSSLLNLLCGEEKAIVTPEEGTTRDIIEQTVPIGRILLRLSDTAGIRESDSTVERIGIDRAREAISLSSLVFLVLDSSSPLTPDDEKLFPLLEGKECVLILNKSDLPGKLAPGEWETRFPHRVSLSAKTGEGKEKLVSLLDEMYRTDLIESEDAIVTGARVGAALKSASEDLSRALTALGDGFTQDIAAIELEHAIAMLDGKTAIETTDSILSDLFSRFCIGK